MKNLNLKFQHEEKVLDKVLFLKNQILKLPKDKVITVVKQRLHCQVVNMAVVFGYVWENLKGGKSWLQITEQQTSNIKNRSYSPQQDTIFAFFFFSLKRANFLHSKEKELDFFLWLWNWRTSVNLEGTPGVEVKKNEAAFRLWHGADLWFFVFAL